MKYSHIALSLLFAALACLAIHTTSAQGYLLNEDGENEFDQTMRNTEWYEDEAIMRLLKALLTTQENKHNSINSIATPTFSGDVIKRGSSKAIDHREDSLRAAMWCRRLRLTRCN